MPHQIEHTMELQMRFQIDQNVKELVDANYNFIFKPHKMMFYNQRDGNVEKVV